MAAHARAEYARMLLGRRSQADLPLAIELIDAGQAIADDLGMAILGGRLAGLAREAQLRAPKRPGSTGPHGLSSRELEVLRLVATGMTNREIADALVVSVRTVDTHVAHVYQKTGARNRSEASAYAASSGISPPPRLDQHL
jgi:DNA-binding NarL/FixJ family response regulator